MTSHIESNWVVLKFGGTSVSSVSNWNNIAGVVRARLADGAHPSSCTPRCPASPIASSNCSPRR